MIGDKRKSSPQLPTKHAAGPPPDSAARKAGMLLLLTAGASAVSVVSRLSANADYPTLAESLAAISESRGLYGMGGAGRFVSGLTLIGGAWLLSRTWIIRERLGTPLVPVLFGASGALTAISGACAAALAASAPSATDITALDSIGSSIDTIASLRWLTGKIGFAAAGLALIVAARYQWKAGGGLRVVSPISAATGTAMQFVWIDAATKLHPISGAFFFIWLVVIGVMLRTGRVEKHFAAMLNSFSKRGARDTA